MQGCNVGIDGVTVDYTKGNLLFHWRQGGTTVVPYAFGFKDETDGRAAAPAGPGET